MVVVVVLLCVFLLGVNTDVVEEDGMNAVVVDDENKIVLRRPTDTNVITRGWFIMVE